MLVKLPMPVPRSCAVICAINRPHSTMVTSAAPQRASRPLVKMSPESEPSWLRPSLGCVHNRLCRLAQLEADVIARRLLEERSQRGDACIVDGLHATAAQRPSDLLNSDHD